MRDTRKEITDSLLNMEEKYQVKVLLAVESGSRAWRIASPDSDYDVRFVYVRKKEDYLKLEPFRDTIEWELNQVLDMNGWDLRKALIQFHKSNATLFEWANSPVVYRTSREWKQVYQAAQGYFSLKASAWHYYGTAKNTYCQSLQEEMVNYKKYFYALRPLLACRYMEEYRCPPPVVFDDLMAVDMGEELREGIRILKEEKMAATEDQKNPRIPVIHRFITEELNRQKELIEAMEDERKEEWNELNEVFLKVIGIIR